MERVDIYFGIWYFGYFILITGSFLGVMLMMVS